MKWALPAFLGVLVAGLVCLWVDIGVSLYQASCPGLAHLECDCAARAGYHWRRSATSLSADAEGICVARCAKAAGG